jgi:hypothetical protein
MRRAGVVPGVLLIVVGVLFGLDSLGVADAWSVVAGWWPLLIVGLGALRLLDRPPDRLGGAITAGIGVIALGFTQGVLTGAALAYAWPLALIGLGLWVLLGRRGPASGEDDAVTAVAVLSGRELAPTSPAFRGGTLVAVLGGVEVDLRAAVPHPDGARLDTTAILGGVDITVPPGWRVRVDGPGILGGHENRAAGQVLPDDAPLLHVRALAVLGGVEVKVGAALHAG